MSIAPISMIIKIPSLSASVSKTNDLYYHRYHPRNVRIALGERFSTIDILLEKFGSASENLNVMQTYSIILHAAWNLAR